MKVPNKIENVVNAFTKIPEHILGKFPGYLMIKDSKSNILLQTKLCQTMGILFTQRGRWNYDDNLKCEAALFAENFRQQDQQAREKDLKILDIYRYADGNVWAVIVDKRSIYDKDDNFIEIVSQAFPLNKYLMQKASVILEKSLTKN